MTIKNLTKIIFYVSLYHTAKPTCINTWGQICHCELNTTTVFKATKHFVYNRKCLIFRWKTMHCAIYSAKGYKNE